MIRLLVGVLLTTCTLSAQQIQKRNKHNHVMVVERERPSEWSNLVTGGRFMDLFLPMPNLNGMTPKAWGAPGVVPRDINNGIEDANWSYWGGNTKLLQDGLYHMFVARWPESAEGGHMAWPLSEVIHATSKNLFGPYKYLAKVGPGHNPEWFITKKGKFVIYVIEGGYIADNVNGPWRKIKFKYNNRDRIAKKVARNYLHNNTFAQRKDGSFIMVNRHGYVWFSKDGISEWGRVSTDKIYPDVPGKYEDPVIWKDHVQYHLTVNDWLGRIAWHSRSKNGVKWKVDSGEAYMPGITKYKNGEEEKWHKYERPKVVQDKYGRALAMNLAVLDTLKYNDLPNDNHSSKLIVVPLNKGCLLEVLTQNKPMSSSDEFKVKIKAEEGFDPLKDMDFASLKFGAPENVDFGKGGELITTKKSGDDLILVFKTNEKEFEAHNFTGKLIGKNKRGELLFGYARLPWVNYKEQILSSRLPQLTTIEKGTIIEVEVQNFGEVISKKSTINLTLGTKNRKFLSLSSVIKILEPFEKTVIQFKTEQVFDAQESMLSKTVITSEGLPDVVFEKK
ncbi:glycoside hydrolase family protein [Wenyingzhuangia sp. IMCC45533]